MPARLGSRLAAGAALAAALAVCAAPPREPARPAAPSPLPTSLDADDLVEVDLRDEGQPALEALREALVERHGVEVELRRLWRVSRGARTLLYAAYAFSAFEAEVRRLESEGRLERLEEDAARESDECWAAERADRDADCAREAADCERRGEPVDDCALSCLPGDLSTSCQRLVLEELPRPDECGPDSAAVALAEERCAPSTPCGGEEGGAPEVELLASRVLGPNRCRWVGTFVPAELDGDGRLEWLLEVQSEPLRWDQMEWTRLSFAVDLLILSGELSTQVETRLLEERPPLDPEAGSPLRLRSVRYAFRDEDGDGAPDLAVSRASFAGECAALAAPPRYDLAASRLALPAAAEGVPGKLARALRAEERRPAGDPACRVVEEREPLVFAYDSARDQWVDPRPAAPPAGGPSAFSATVGLDLRALPAGTRASGVDLFVLAQGDRLRALAGPGAEVEIRHVPGTGVLVPVFRAETARAADALCRRTVASYLERAPRLPVTMQPAARLVEPCRALPEEAAHPSPPE